MKKFNTSDREEFKKKKKKTFTKFQYISKISQMYLKKTLENRKLISISGKNRQQMLKKDELFVKRT